VRVARRGPGRPRTTPDSLSGDKAYSSRANRELLRAPASSPSSPNAPTRSGTDSARAAQAADRSATTPEQYKNRNVVERFFNRMKHWRGLASRFDKHAVNYRGGVVLAAVVDWLKQS
jgi:transposase